MLLLLLLNITLEFLAVAIKEEKVIKDMQIEKEGIISFVFTTIVYIENLKGSINMLLELVSNLIKVVE